MGTRLAAIAVVWLGLALFCWRWVHVATRGNTHLAFAIRPPSTGLVGL